MSKKKIIIGVVIFLVAIAGIGGYFYYKDIPGVGRGIMAKDLKNVSISVQ